MKLIGPKTKRVNTRMNPLLIMGTVSIISGGILSAVVAKNPTYLTSWAVAYMILVVGVIQILVALSIERLAVVKLNKRFVWILFVLLNLGNFDVLVGTVVKYESGSNSLVYIGGVAISLAMLMAFYAVRRTKMSWALLAYYLGVLSVITSMSIGLLLSNTV